MTDRRLSSDINIDSPSIQWISVFWELMASRLNEALQSDSQTYPIDWRVEDHAVNPNDAVCLPELDTTFLAGRGFSQPLTLYDKTVLQLESYLAEIMWNLGQQVFNENNLNGQKIQLQRPGVFTVQRLRILEQFGLTHIIKCLSKISVVHPSNDISSLPKINDIVEFLKRPTRLFVLLEIAYIFEACSHLREFLRFPSISLLNHSGLSNPENNNTQHPTFYHPILNVVSEVLMKDNKQPKNIQLSSNVDGTFAFLSALFYPLQEVVRTSSSKLRAAAQLTERCLILHLFTRVPAGPALKNYIPEMIPLLLSVLANDDEITVDAAHRLLFTIFKSFHREFDTAESYLQVATSFYSQALHACSAQMKPWYHIVKIDRRIDLKETELLSSAIISSSDTPSNELLNNYVPQWFMTRLTGNWDPSLNFLFVPEGTFLSQGRTSLKLLMEIPLMVMLLMQLNVSPVRVHATVILERLLQFLSFLEPHKNYIRVETLLKNSELPPDDLLLLDFKLQKDLLDAQVKTVAFVSFFLRGSFNPHNPSGHSSNSANTSNAQGETTACQTNPLLNSFGDIGSTITQYLKIAPYQVGNAFLSRWKCILEKDITTVSAHLVKPRLSVRLEELPSNTFFDTDQDNFRSIYCRREVLVSLRSIIGSSEFKAAPPAGSLSRTLSSRIHLGFGLTAVDYLKPFICQLRIEMINHLRSSEVLQRLLLAEVSSSRACRTEYHQLHLRALLEASEIANSIAPHIRHTKLLQCFRWKLFCVNSKLDSIPNKSLMKHIYFQDIHTNDSTSLSQSDSNENKMMIDHPCDKKEDLPSCQSSDSSINSNSITYGEIRALILSRASNYDTQRGIVLPSDKFLPMSILAHLTHAICIDLHDYCLPLFTQTHLVRALLVIAEWVDRLCLGFRARPNQTTMTPTGTQSSTGVSHFMDQKEAADIHRRILESCSAKLLSLKQNFPKLLSASRGIESHRGTVSSAGESFNLRPYDSHPINDNSTDLKDEHIPDLFRAPRQSAWVSPPLLSFSGSFGSVLHPGARPSLVELLKEIRILLRTLCQAVRTASFLLTVVGVPCNDIIGNNKETGDLLRLQHAVPLADSDYQLVRDAFFYAIQLGLLYSNALSRTVMYPCYLNKVNQDHGPPIHSFWKKLDQSLLMNPVPLSCNVPNVPSPTSWNAGMFTVQGHHYAIHIDKQLSIIQQEEKEMLESAATILTSLHPSICHRFLYSYLSLLINMIERHPSLVILFDILSQQSSTAQALITVLGPYLLTHLPRLCDTLGLNGLSLPDHIGQAACDIESQNCSLNTIDCTQKNNSNRKRKRYCHSTQDNDKLSSSSSFPSLSHSRQTGSIVETPGATPFQDSVNSSLSSRSIKRHRSGIIVAKGHLLFDKSTSYLISSKLSQFIEAPFLPVDLFDPRLSAYCPVLQIQDKDLDRQLLQETPLKWDFKGDGFFYTFCKKDISNTNENHLEIMPSHSEQYLESFYSDHILVPTNLPLCPTILSQPTCSHHLRASAFGCNHKESPHLITSITSSVPTDEEACNTSEMSNFSPKQYLYLPRCSSYAEAATVSTLLSSRKQYLVETRTVVISSNPENNNYHLYTNDRASLATSYSLLTSPSLKNDETNYTSRCLATDPTLCTSKEWLFEKIHMYQHLLDKTATTLSKNNPISSADVLMFKSFEPIPIINDFMVIEGLYPGIDTLTHTATGHVRLPSSQILSRLWKLLLKLLAHLPEVQNGLQSIIEHLVCNILSMASSVSRSHTLLGIIRCLFRYSAAALVSAGVKNSQILFNDRSGSSQGLSQVADGSLTNSTSALMRDFPVVWFLSFCELLANSHPPIVQEAIAEICLMAPVSSSMLPKFSHLLINPLLSAMSSRDTDLLSVALRSLETLIDSVDQENSLACLTATNQKEFDFSYRSPLFSRLLALIEPIPRPICSGPKTITSELYLTEWIDPLKRCRVFLQEGDESPATRNSLSSYACRIVGKLGKVVRGLLLEPALLNRKLPLQDELFFGFPLFSTTRNKSPIFVPNCTPTPNSDEILDNTTTQLFITDNDIVPLFLSEAISAAIAVLDIPRTANTIPQLCLQNTLPGYTAIASSNFASRVPLDIDISQYPNELLEYNSNISDAPAYPYLFGYPNSFVYNTITRLNGGSVSSLPGYYGVMKSRTEPSVRPVWNIRKPQAIYCHSQDRRAVLSGVEGLSPAWNSPRTVHKTFKHSSELLRKGPAVIRSQHSIPLQTWGKKQAQEFLGQVLLQFFDLNILPEEIETFIESMKRIPILQKNKDHFRYKRSIFLSKTIQSIVRGLLIAAIDFDSTIKSSARKLLIALTGYIGMILVCPNIAIPHITPLSKNFLINPMEFVSALVKVLDLAPWLWATTAFSIQLLKHLVHIALSFRVPNSNLMSEAFIRPFLNCCYSNSSSVCGAGAWMFFELIKSFPMSWAKMHFHRIATALLRVIRYYTIPNGLQPILNQPVLLAAGVAHEALCLLCLSAFQNLRDTKYLNSSVQSIMRKDTTDNDLDKDVVDTQKTTLTWDCIIHQSQYPTNKNQLPIIRSLLTLLFTQIIPDCLDTRLIVRQHAYIFLKRLATYLRTTIVKMFLFIFSEDVLTNLDVSNSMFLVLSSKERFPRYPTQSADKTECSSQQTLLHMTSDVLISKENNIPSTLLGQLLLRIDRQYNFTSSHLLMSAAMDCLSFLLAVRDPEFTFTKSFLSRSAVLALIVFTRARLGYNTLSLQKNSFDSVANKPKESSVPQISQECPKLVMENMRSEVAIHALRVAKLVNIHSSNLLCCDGTTTTTALPNNNAQNTLIETPNLIPSLFESLGIIYPANLDNIPEIGLGMLLDAAGDVDSHIGQAAQHALLIVGCYRAQKRSLDPSLSSSIDIKNSINSLSPPRILLSSLFPEEFLFSHLKTLFGVLGTPSRRTAAQFLALARAIYLFKPTFNSPSVASRLVDVAFGLCDACDGLVKQIAGLQPRPGAKVTPENSSPLENFSPSLIVSEVPVVAAGLIYCFSGLHPSAFDTLPLCRSALRLLVGLLDFVELTLVQARHQQQNHLISSGWNASNNMKCTVMEYPHYNLSDIFVEFCISHAATVTETVWLRTEGNPASGSSTSPKLTLPFILARGKTAAFVCRALRSSKAQPFRDSMTKKISLMSRLLKERIEIQFPGLMFTPFSDHSENIPSTLTPLPSDNNVASVYSPTLGSGDAYHTRSPMSTSVMPKWMIKDLAGNGSEALPSSSYDIIVIITILTRFNSSLLIVNWMSHARKSIGLQGDLDDSIKVPGSTIFHTYPIMLDLDCPWTSTCSYALIHCLLDVWNLSSGLMLQVISESIIADIEKEENDLNELNPALRLNEDKAVKSRVIYDENIYPRKLPITGYSWSSTLTLSSGGCTAWADFHCLFHTPTALSLANEFQSFIISTTSMAYTYYNMQEGEDTLYWTLKEDELDIIKEKWINVQFKVLRLKIILSLCVPNAIRTPQDFGFIDNFFSLIINWNQQSSVPKSISTTLHPIPKQEARYLLRLFFLFILFNAQIPPSFKISICQLLIVPLLIYASEDSDNIDPLLPLNECREYFKEIAYLNPSLSLRSINISHKGIDLHHYNLTLRLVSLYFELTLSREFDVPNKTSEEPNILLLCDKYSIIPQITLSITDLDSNEELQVELLRVMKYLADIGGQKDSNNITTVALNNTSLQHTSRKELFWKLCKSESLVVRHWAYYYISSAIPSQFWLLAESQRPSNRELLEFLVILFQCPQLETRVLTRSCIDLIIQANIFSPEILTNDFILPLFFYLSSLEGSMPHVQILQGLCQLVVRHQYRLFQCREALGPSCAAALGRVALNAGGETRRVILDLVHVILMWEFHAHLETIATPWYAFSSESPLLETCGYYTMKAALTSTNDPPMVARGISAMTRCLLLNPQTPVRFQSILKCLQLQPSLTSGTQYVNKRTAANRLALLVLEVFHILVTFQDSKIFLSSMGQLVQTLDLIWSTTDLEVIRALCSLIEKIIQLIPPPPSNDLKNISNIIITTSTPPSDIFWIRLFQVISAGLSTTGYHRRSTSDGISEHQLGGEIHYLLMRPSTKEEGSDYFKTETISENCWKVILEQYKLMNSVLEAYEKPTPGGQPSDKQHNTIAIDPYLACSLLFSLTAIDANIYTNKHINALSMKQDNQIETDVDCQSLNVMPISKHFILLAFGNSIIQAMRCLAKILADSQSVIQINNIPINTTPINKPIKPPSYPTISKCEYLGGTAVEIPEQRLALLSQFLHLGCMLFLCGDETSKYTTLTDSTNYLTVPNIFSWEKFIQQIDIIYKEEFIYTNLNIYFQRFFYFFLIDIPKKNSNFGLLYECLKIVGYLMYGPVYNPFEFWESSSLRIQWENGNERPFNTQTQTIYASQHQNRLLNNDQLPFKYLSIHPLTLDPTNNKFISGSIGYLTYDFLDGPLACRTWKNLEFIINHIQSEIDKHSKTSLLNWTDLWAQLTLKRGRCFLSRSINNILNDYFTPPDPALFGPLHASHILNEWSMLFDSQDVAETQFFFYDLIDRLLDAPGPPLISNNLVTESLSISSVSVESPIQEHCIKDSNLSEVKYLIPINQTGYSGVIGIWVPNVEGLLVQIDSANNEFNFDQSIESNFQNESENQASDSLVVTRRQLCLEQSSNFINLFFPILLGALSSHPAIHQNFVNRLHRHLPRTPHLRLLSFLRRPELSKLTDKHLTGLLAELFILSCPTHTTLSSSVTPKFPSLKQGSLSSSERVPNDGPPPTSLYLQGNISEHDLMYKLKNSADELYSDFISETSHSPAKQTMLPDRNIEDISHWTTQFSNYLTMYRNLSQYPNTWLNPLRHLAWSSPSVATGIINAIIPGLWKLLSLESQIILADALIPVLSWDDQELETKYKKLKETESSWLSDSLFDILLTQQELNKSQQSSTSASPPNDFFLVRNILLDAQRPQIFSATTQILSTEGSTDTTSGVACLCRIASNLIDSVKPNYIVAPLLEAFTRCAPPIILPPSVLRHVAVHFSCWHAAAYQAFHQLLTLSPRDTSRLEHVSVLTELWHKLSEFDAAHAATTLVAVSNETRATLSDTTAGRWSRAQDILNGMLKRLNTVTGQDAVAGQQIIASSGLGGLNIAGILTAQEWLSEAAVSQDFDKAEIHPHSNVLDDQLLRRIGIELTDPHELLELKLASQAIKGELTTWTDNWIKASTQLNQWNSLSEISSMSNVALTQDARSKLQDWVGVERLVTAYGLATPQAAIGLFYSGLQRIANELPFNVQPVNGNQWKTPAGNPSVPTLQRTGSRGNGNTANRIGETTPGSVSNIGGVPSSIQLKLDDMEELLVVCQKLVVAGARSLPTIPGASHLHSCLSSQLQVEATEGFRWVMEFLRKVVIGSGRPGLTPVEAVDNRALMMTWRTRLLSHSDDMRSWSDLLVWRNCLFTVVQSLVSCCPMLSQDQQALWATYQQDVAWTILKFARVANWPHGLPDVALALLSKLHTLHTFFTSPAYAADYLMTVARCVKLCRTPQQLLAGLNLIRAVDMNQYISAPATWVASETGRSLDPIDKLKAILFMEKSRILSDMPQLPFVQNASDPTHTTTEWTTQLSSILRNVLDPNRPVADRSVSTDQTAASATFVAQLNSPTATTASTTPPPPFSNMLFSRPNNLQHAFNDLTVALELCPTLGRAWATWGMLADRAFGSGAGTVSKQADMSHGTAAILGYIMAAYLRPHKASHYLGRVLWLLVYDDDSRTLSRTFGRFSDIVVPSLWLPWIPQLLSGLERIAGIQSYSILQRLLKTFPHSTFYDVRAYFFEKAAILHRYATATQKFSQTSINGNSHLPEDWPCSNPSLETDESLVQSDVDTNAVSGINIDPNCIEEVNNQTSTGAQTLIPPLCVVQAEELSHQLLVSLFEQTAGPLCALMDALADRITATCLPTRFDEILRNMRFLIASLIDLPFGQDPMQPMANTQSGQQGMSLVASCPNYLSSSCETPVPRHLEKFLMDKILLKFLQIMTMPGSHEDIVLLKSSQVISRFWPSIAADFGWASVLEAFLLEKETLRNNWVAMPSSLEQSVLSLSVETCIGVLKKWVDCLDPISQYLGDERLNDLQDMFSATFHPGQLSQRLLVSGYCSDNSVDTDWLSVLQVPGISTRLLFQNPMVSCGKSKILSNSDFRGFELTAINIIRGSEVPGAEAGRVSTGGLRSNGRMVRISFAAANGVSHSFLVEPCGSLQQRSEQRVSTLLGLTSLLLLTGKEARRRGVTIPVAASIPLHPHCRLLHSPETCTTLQAIYDEHSGLPDPAVPQLLYRRLLKEKTARWLAIKMDKQEKQKIKKSVTSINTSTSQSGTAGGLEVDINQNKKLAITDESQPSTPLTNTQRATGPSIPRETLAKAYKDVYTDLCSLVSPDIAKCYIHNCFPDAEQLAAGLKRITTDLGIWSLLSYSLFVTDLLAHKIVFDLRTARLSISGFKSTIRSDNLMLYDNVERIPFRLTRNLLHLIGPLGRHGGLPGTMFAVLDGLAIPKNDLAFRTFVSLTLRDDLWAATNYKCIGRQLQPFFECTSRIPGCDISQDETCSNSGNISDFSVFCGNSPILSAPDLLTINELSKLSWTRQTLPFSTTTTVRDPTKDPLPIFIMPSRVCDLPEESPAQHPISQTTESDELSESRKVTQNLLPASGLTRRERIKHTSDRGNGALTIGQVRDKAERNTRKVIDRLGHLYTACIPISKTTEPSQASPPLGDKIKTSDSGVSIPATEVPGQAGNLGTSATSNCYAKINELIEAAVRPSNIAGMPPSWYPWL